MIEDLFDFIIIGYCKAEQKDWWSISEEERWEFWDTYIYPNFNSEIATRFLRTQI